jgi:deoxyribonuclease-4
MRLGAHMSIAGGFYKALLRGNELGCEVIQVFTKSPGNWGIPEIPKKELNRWEETRSEVKIDPVIAHDCYLVNLASPDRALREKSMSTLMLEMERAASLGIELFVIHPGAHTGSGEPEGLKQISDALDRVLSGMSDTGIQILLETTAGQGTSLGYRFEHLAEIIERCSFGERLGICFDTCHVFAAGYDISNEEGYLRVMDELNSMVGLERIRAVHVNDSKRDLGSRVDRHEHIGRGKIGRRGISYFLSDERLRGLPFILETPKGIGDRLDRLNLKTLKSMRAKKKQKPVRR